MDTVTSPVADPYLDFLRAKMAFAPCTGFDVADSEINPLLLPHQRVAVQWAIAGGRRALFESFGLGKTLQQLEIVRLVLKRLSGGRGLIICPLGVRQEFARDAAMIGLTVTFVRRTAEVDAPGIYLTNYESVRDGRLDPNLFDVVSLDEASVLRSFGSKTYQTFLTLFAGVPYRFVATATPSPNKFKELIHYGGFLGIMDTGQALAQPLDAKVLTPKGWKTMGEMQVDDLVIAVDGTQTKVIGVYPQDWKNIYRVSLSDGSSTECTEEHLWLTRTQYERNNEARYKRRNGPDAFRCGKFASVKTTSEIASTLVCSSTGSKNHEVPVVSIVDFAARQTSVNPYLLGILLGDGHIRTTSVSFSSADPYIVQTVREIVSADYGLAVHQISDIRKDGRPCFDFAISSGNGKGSGGGRGSFSNNLLNDLRAYDLLEKRAWNKRVPEDYLFNDISTRLAVLQGLMDSDGTIDIDNRTISFLSTSEGLAKDVQSLVRSLGGIATIWEQAPSGGGEIAGRKVQGKRLQHSVNINLPAGINPFRLPRKANRVVPKMKYKPVRYITSIELICSKQAQCIAVEHPDHLYVTDDFIVTHNTRFFQRDSTQANNLTLYPHKAEEFWLWLASWALFLDKPSTLGFADTGYDLPPVTVVHHELPATSLIGATETNGQTTLMVDAGLSLSTAAREKRDSLPARIARMCEIVGGEAPDTHFLLWHTLEAERHAIKAALPDAVTVYGTQDMDEREAAIMDFSDGRIRLLATKPEIAGSGCNFQRHCHQMVFLGVDYKANDLMQSIHRLQRFQQPHPVTVHLIYTESERKIVRELLTKWENHKKMTHTMTDLIKKHGLNGASMQEVLQRTIGVERLEVSGERFCVANNDAVLEARRLATDSVGEIVTSIPFGNHYEYAASFNDFGHTSGNDHFWAQMNFLTPELLRILQPGRIACIHVKDRILFGNVTGAGYPTSDLFHCEAAFHFRKHGFEPMGMITIVTDVVRENNQTYRLGWNENSKDSTKMGVGCPEYVLLFRKPQTERGKGYADLPVTKGKADYTRARWQVDAHAFWRSSGNRQVTAREMAAYGPAKLAQMFTQFSLADTYDYEFHVKIGEELDALGALPSSFMTLAPGSHDADVWHDINRMRTLNTAQSQKGKESHVCPLQFDIVDRCIERYSNPGELVYDPFAGLGTVPIRAILKGRRGGGSELNPSYFLDSAHYLKAAEMQMSMPALFDFDDVPSLGKFAPPGTSRGA